MLQQSMGGYPNSVQLRASTFEPWDQGKAFLDDSFPIGRVICSVYNPYNDKEVTLKDTRIHRLSLNLRESKEKYPSDLKFLNGKVMADSSYDEWVHAIEEGKGENDEFNYGASGDSCSINFETEDGRNVEMDISISSNGVSVDFCLDLLYE